jgi:hypothetical protein
MTGQAIRRTAGCKVFFLKKPITEVPKPVLTSANYPKANLADTFCPIDTYYHMMFCRNGELISAWFIYRKGYKSGDRRTSPVPY